MSAPMKISKKQFLSNISEWCWAGNGRNDLKEGDASIHEPVCDTYTRWIAEWVVKFNALNTGFKLDFRVISDGYAGADYYSIYRVEPKRLVFPSDDDAEDEIYTLTEAEAEASGMLSKESNIAEDEDEDENECAQCHTYYPTEHFNTDGKCFDCFHGEEGEADE